MSAVAKKNFMPVTLHCIAWHKPFLVEAERQVILLQKDMNRATGSTVPGTSTVCNVWQIC